MDIWALKVTLCVLVLAMAPGLASATQDDEPDSINFYVEFMDRGNDYSLQGFSNLPPGGSVTRRIGEYTIRMSREQSEGPGEGCCSLRVAILDESLTPGSRVVVQESWDFALGEKETVAIEKGSIAMRLEFVVYRRAGA